MKIYGDTLASRINRKFIRLGMGSLQLRRRNGQYYLQHRPTEYVLAYGLDVKLMAHYMTVLQPDETVA